MYNEQYSASFFTQTPDCLSMTEKATFNLRIAGILYTMQQERHTKGAGHKSHRGFLAKMYLRRELLCSAARQHRWHRGGTSIQSVMQVLVCLSCIGSLGLHCLP